MNMAYPDNLPRGLAEIADIIGLELALVLANNYGGVPQYIPQMPSNEHKLVAAIGLPALKQLSTMYGGSWLEIPRYAVAKTKKVTIKKLLKNGVSVRETASVAQVTVRYVTLVASQMQEESRQLSFFD